jgi:serine O-acetyltransferase
MSFAITPQPILGLSLGEVALLYAFPVLCLIALWLLVSAVVYVMVRSSAEFNFKADLLRKFEAKKRLRSGRNLKLSFRYIAQLLLGDNCIQAVLLYRVSRFLLLRRLTLPAQVVYSFSRFATNTDIPPWAAIGPGLLIYHGVGTVIGKGCKIGDRALICQGVAIAGRATAGDDVIVRAGAKVIGKVTLGDRCEVGVNAVVINDVPPDSIVFGVPARLAGRREPAAAPDAVEAAEDEESAA